jgi:hypothetical protein
LQQNIVIRPWGTTTSAHMTANVRQEMLYPVVAFTRLKEGGPIIMLGWIFVSDDLSHDFQQVRTGDIWMLALSIELSFNCLRIPLCCEMKE